MAPLITTLGIMLPLFLLIALGAVLRQRGVLEEQVCTQMNTLSFNLLIPALVFHNIYTADLAAMSDPRLLLLTFGGTTGVVLVLMLLVPRLVSDPARVGVLVQGSFRSSFVILGMGIAATIYPGQNLGSMALTSALVAPMFAVYSVLSLELFTLRRPGVGAMAKSVVKNPLVLASALALGLLLLGLRLPGPLDTLIRSLSSCATPISLMMLGGSLRFDALREDRGLLLAASMIKLVVLPLLFVPLGVALGFRGVELLTVLVLFGSPATVAGHVMAVQARGDGQLAGQVVVVTTCLSAFTLSAFLYILLSLGLL